MIRFEGVRLWRGGLGAIRGPSDFLIVLLGLMMLFALIVGSVGRIQTLPHDSRVLAAALAAVPIARFTHGRLDRRLQWLSEHSVLSATSLHPRERFIYRLSAHAMIVAGCIVPIALLAGTLSDRIWLAVIVTAVAYVFGMAISRIQIPRCLNRAALSPINGKPLAQPPRDLAAVLADRAISIRLKRRRRAIAISLYAFICGFAGGKFSAEGLVGEALICLTIGLPLAALTRLDPDLARGASLFGVAPGRLAVMSLAHSALLCISACMGIFVGSGNRFSTFVFAPFLGWWAFAFLWMIRTWRIPGRTIQAANLLAMLDLIVIAMLSAFAVVLVAPIHLVLAWRAHRSSAARLWIN